MKVPAADRRHGLKFNITSLIDVVFLLIIFFLCTSHFARSEFAETIQLPDAAERDEDDPADPRPRVVVTINSDRVLHVGGRPIDRILLLEMLRAGAIEHGARFEVRLRADRDVPFREIEPILVDCARSGIVDVKFAVLPVD